MSEVKEHIMRPEIKLNTLLISVVLLYLEYVFEAINKIITSHEEDITLIENLTQCMRP